VAKFINNPPFALFMAKKESPKESPKKEDVQPVVNIGLIGHVDHGKTTLTERLSGKWTDTHSEELRRGITIRLGYADSIFRKCTKCKKLTANDKCDCGGKTEFVRKVSFVDAPGHESLMATMLAGATIMDGALLLIAGNEECPQPQTREHLMALEIMGVENIVVIQNKIDVMDEKRAMKNYKEIKAFLKGTKYEDAPIIPISAKHNANIDVLIEAIEKYIPTPKRSDKEDPLMLIARSFDINKPGSKPKELVGGVLGGALIRGVFKVGDEIELRPGRKIEKGGRTTFEDVKTKITELKTGGTDVKDVHPGGSIGVLTSLDPSVVKSDAFVGSLAGLTGKLPPILNEIELETHLLKRVVGSKEDLDVEPIKQNEMLMLNVNAAATIGIVTELSKGRCKCALKKPVCADKDSRMTISRRINNRFRLIGYGLIK
jgi:translation initiation factor 2 subunit 3